MGTRPIEPSAPIAPRTYIRWDGPTWGGDPEVRAEWLAEAVSCTPRATGLIYAPTLTFEGATRAVAALSTELVWKEQRTRDSSRRFAALEGVPSYEVGERSWGLPRVGECGVDEDLRELAKALVSAIPCGADLRPVRWAWLAWAMDEGSCPIADVLRRAPGYDVVLDNARAALAYLRAPERAVAMPRLVDLLCIGKLFAFPATPIPDDLFWALNLLRWALSPIESDMGDEGTAWEQVARDWGHMGGSSTEGLAALTRLVAEAPAWPAGEVAR